MAAAAVTITPADIVQGIPVIIAGTNFAVSTNVNVSILGPDFDVTVTVVSGLAGEFTTSGVLAFKPLRPGVWRVSVSDGSTTVASQFRVQSGG